MKNEIYEFAEALSTAINKGNYNLVSLWFVQMLIDRFKGDYWIDVLYVPSEEMFIARMYEVGEEASEGHYYNVYGCCDCKYKDFDESKGEMINLVDLFEKHHDMYLKLMRKYKDLKEVG